MPESSRKHADHLQAPAMNGLNIEAVLAVNFVRALECARTIRHTKFGAKDPLMFSPYMPGTCSGEATFGPGGR